MSVELELIKKLKTPEEKFNLAVEKCKSLIKDRKDIAYRIAQIAIEVCVIEHGGKSKSNKLSLKVFADAIGKNYKSLHRWVREYKVVVMKLPASEVDKGINRVAVERLLKNTNGAETKKQITNMYRDESAKDTYLYNVLKRLGNVKFAICHSIYYDKIDEDDFNQIYTNIKEMYKTVDKYKKNKKCNRSENEKIITAKLNEVRNKEKSLQ